jgi:hypothetical protein
MAFAGRLRTIAAHGYLTPKQAAEFTNISVHELERLRRERRGPRFNLVSSRLIRYSVLRCWVRGSIHSPLVALPTLASARRWHVHNDTPKSDMNKKMAPGDDGSQIIETVQGTEQEQLSNNGCSEASGIPLPDYARSVDFLRRFHPGRFWVLTAISLDKRSIDTKTFGADSVAECLRWLET